MVSGLISMGSQDLVLGTWHGNVGDRRLDIPTMKQEERVLPSVKLRTSVITLGPVFSRLFSRSISFG